MLTNGSDWAFANVATTGSSAPLCRRSASRSTKRFCFLRCCQPSPEQAAFTSRAHRIECFCPGPRRFEIHIRTVRVLLVREPLHSEGDLSIAGMYIQSRGLSIAGMYIQSRDLSIAGMYIQSRHHRTIPEALRNSAKFIIFSTRSIIFSTKFMIFDTRLRMCSQSSPGSVALNHPVYSRTFSLTSGCTPFRLKNPASYPSLSNAQCLR